ncbi:MAG: cytidylate kinase-like family protein [Thaumarchaeota archaeon]|nr:cytidylate kinase-like family protein [Nitrososphaerota archaeon]
MRQVITVSREIGTDGDIVAKRVAEELGFNHLDRKLLGAQAQRLGINIYEAEVCDISEDDYRIRGLVESIFSDTKIITVVESPSIGSSLVQTARTLNEETCINIEGTIIKELAKKGRLVVVGRGGQALLKDFPDTLHAKIIAPYEYRVRKLMNDKKIGIIEAAKIIKERDAATAQYLRRFYKVDWNDNQHYSIIINMARFSVPQAVSCITKLASSE